MFNFRFAHDALEPRKASYGLSWAEVHETKPVPEQSILDTKLNTAAKYWCGTNHDIDCTMVISSYL
jgi:hypothetical protein